MAAFDSNLSFGPFDPDLDPTSVGFRFTKYLERFTVYSLAMNERTRRESERYFCTALDPKSRTFLTH